MLQVNVASRVVLLFVLITFVYDSILGIMSYSEHMAFGPLAYLSDDSRSQFSTIDDDDSLSVFRSSLTLNESPYTGEPSTADTRLVPVSIPRTDFSNLGTEELKKSTDPVIHIHHSDNVPSNTNDKCHNCRKKTRPKKSSYTRNVKHARPAKPIGPKKKPAPRHYPVNLTRLQLVSGAHECCVKWCVCSFDVVELQVLRDRWIEESRLAGPKDCMQNMLVLRAFHNYCDPLSKKIQLKINDKPVCRNAFGMIFCISRSRLYRRSNEALQGFQRYFRKQLSTRVDDLSLTTAVKEFIERTANHYGEMMPHEVKRVIPMTLATLRKHFMAETGRYISNPHMCTIFALNRKDISVYQVSTKFNCGICTMITRDMARTASTDVENIHCLTEQWQIHWDNHRKQRLHFMQNMADSRNELRDKQIMILTDGMDQAKSRCPNMPNEIETTGMQRLQTHIFGVFMIGRLLRCFIDFRDTKHNTNQNISRILDIILEAARAGRLPRDTLIIQLDNTCSQNKNITLFTFCGILVMRKIFKKVIVNFLMIGHTHNDIDRIFSYFSKIFTKLGNPTVEAMLRNIADSHQDKIDNVKPTTTICDENWAVDIWLDDSKSIIKKFSIYHGFMIEMHDIGGPELEPGMRYREWAQDPWSEDVVRLFGQDDEGRTVEPIGHPLMEVPNYLNKTKIPVDDIKKTIAKMLDFDTLNETHNEEWDGFWDYWDSRIKHWNSKPKVSVDKPVGDLTYCYCDWKKWPLDELEEILGEQDREFDDDEWERSVIKPEHYILKKFEKIAERVITAAEQRVTRHLNDIQTHHVTPGKYGIVLPHLEDCVAHRCLPSKRPFVVKILSCTDSTDQFMFRFIEKKRTGKQYQLITEEEEKYRETKKQMLAAKKLNPTLNVSIKQGKKPESDYYRTQHKFTQPVYEFPDNMEDEDTIDTIKGDNCAHYRTLMQIFIKTTGFSPSGLLRQHIITAHEDQCEELKLDAQYEKILKEAVAKETEETAVKKELAQRKKEEAQRKKEETKRMKEELKRKQNSIAKRATKEKKRKNT